jgi:hypothetical protein
MIIAPGLAGGYSASAEIKATRALVDMRDFRKLFNIIGVKEPELGTVSG